MRRGQLEDDSSRKVARWAKLPPRFNVNRGVAVACGGNQRLDGGEWVVAVLVMVFAVPDFPIVLLPVVPLVVIFR
jgi:hypothetical protein